MGTKERVWIDVLLFTGLRRGDAVRLGRQHVRNGVATLRTEKSQGAVTVYLPILPILQATLDAGPVGDLAFIVGKSGKPFTKEVVRQCLQGGLRQSRPVASFRAWLPQDRSNARGKERSDRRATERDLWLERYRNGVSLHAGGGPQAACA